MPKAELLLPVVRKIANKYKTVSTYKEFENHAHWVIGEPGWGKIAEFVADWIEQSKVKTFHKGN